MSCHTPLVLGCEGKFGMPRNPFLSNLCQTSREIHCVFQTAQIVLEKSR